MNLTPIIRSLSKEDFDKMLAACKYNGERTYLKFARYDPDFEYHIDLPGSTGDGQNLGQWLQDEERFK